MFGSVKNIANISVYPVAIQRALQYLQETDFMQMEAGSYEIEGKQLFAQVIDTTTGKLEERFPEIHRKYIDVQFLVQGSEAIGFVTDNGQNEIKEDALAERDVLFYHNVENENFIEMLPGSFAVFYPNDVHRPNCNVQEETAIRKVIVKVSTELL